MCPLLPRELPAPCWLELVLSFHLFGQGRFCIALQREYRNGQRGKSTVWQTEPSKADLSPRRTGRRSSPGAPGLDFNTLLKTWHCSSAVCTAILLQCGWLLGLSPEPSISVQEGRKRAVAKHWHNVMECKQLLDFHFPPTSLPGISEVVPGSGSLFTVPLLAQSAQVLSLSPVPSPCIAIVSHTDPPGASSHHVPLGLEKAHQTRGRSSCFKTRCLLFSWRRKGDNICSL